MRQTDCDALVLQQTVVVRLLKAKDLCEDKTLQGNERSVIDEGVQSSVPLKLNRFYE